MRHVHRLTVPYPISANNYWRVQTFGKRAGIFVTQEAKRYKEAVGLLAKGRSLLGGELVLRLNVFRPRKIGDLDNSLKVLLDSLKGVLFLDDKQVRRIEAERFDDAANPRAEIMITQHQRTGDQLGLDENTPAVTARDIEGKLIGRLIIATQALEELRDEARIMAPTEVEAYAADALRKMAAE